MSRTGKARWNKGMAGMGWSCRVEWGAQHGPSPGADDFAPPACGEESVATRTRFLRRLAMGGWAGQTRRRLALLGNAGQQRRRTSKPW
jgi:hypothetical protein